MASNLSTMGVTWARTSRSEIVVVSNPAKPFSMSTVAWVVE